MERRKGQAIVESLFVLLILLAAFFLFYDFAYGLVVRLHLNNAAARSARAATVGFNDFHRGKAIRVSMIPVSGKRLVPDNGRIVKSGEGELGLVRSYLQSHSSAEARGILDYERWSTLKHSVDWDHNEVRTSVSFDYPLSSPSRLISLFGAGSLSCPSCCSTCNHIPAYPKTRTIKSLWKLENHASYYLQETLND